MIPATISSLPLQDKAANAKHSNNDDDYSTTIPEEIANNRYIYIIQTIVRSVTGVTVHTPSHQLHRHLHHVPHHRRLPDSYAQAR
jgi:DUF2075 family protein